MVEKIKEEPFRLTQADPVISAANGVASRWSDVWKYQVPIGVKLLILPTHTFGCYLRDTSPAEVGDSTCRVKIEKRDPAEGSVICLYGADLYVASKEFQDQSKLARMKVPGGGITIDEREFLVISAYDDATIAYATSYFEMHIAKVRRALGA